MNDIPKIYRITITLEDSSPSVWRRIEIPSHFSFADLHLTLQDAMGWEDDHAYEFRFGGKIISNPDLSESGDRDVDFTRLDEFFTDADSCIYIYDMGDCWRHRLELEERHMPDEDQMYPWCMDGSGACPPEDCGGILRYNELMAAVKDKKNPDHNEALDILCKKKSPKTFKPEYFDIEAANFSIENYSYKLPFRIPPTTEQWKKLYDLAFRVRDLKPWQQLWDSDYIIVELPGRDEPVYFVTMGRIGECMAVAVYDGNNAFANLELMRERADDGAFFTAAGIQNCVTCFFGDREEVVKEDREVMKELNIKFRGRGQWIYFRSMRSGYAPWLLSYKEAELLCEAFEQYTAALDDLAAGLKIDFRDGRSLTRKYSPPPMAEGWESYDIPLGKIQLSFEQVIITDELYVARMKRLKKTNTQLEIDMMYLPMPVQENKESRPYLPRFVMAVDCDTGLVLNQELMSPEDDTSNSVLTMISTLITSLGKPRCIYVRDHEMGNILRDLCDKLNIKLEHRMSMPVLDEAVVSLMGYLGFDEDLES